MTSRDASRADIQTGMQMLADKVKDHLRSLREQGRPVSAEQEIRDAFHLRYYYGGLEGGTWTQTRWMGATVLKTPFDLRTYQELLFGVRPQLIIETGTAHGGSALYFAHLCDILGEGRVVTIDIDPAFGGGQRPRHPRITYLTGSSTDPAVFARATRSGAGSLAGERVMVVLDSDHSAAHVATELELYALLVSEGSYIVVEDSNISGHPVPADGAPGPMEAIVPFLERHPEFGADPACERHLFSFNPRGWLKRLPAGADRGGGGA
ncbi:MAG: cephalosporin hydroxylase [Betaproteobacteria bacterium]|nr:cephalosporin hydroxylase [Betaproteobacteria bacterium]